MLSDIATGLFSVLFGYIVVAYFAGKALPTLQLVILNFLYICISVYIGGSFLLPLALSLLPCISTRNYWYYSHPGDFHLLGQLKRFIPGLLCK